VLGAGDVLRVASVQGLHHLDAEAGATSSAIYKRALEISQGLPDPLAPQDSARS
jgi:hypothetical protein